MSSIHRLLEKDLIRVTEKAAIAAAHTMGLGRRKYSDHVAVEAMREELGRLPIRGLVHYERWGEGSSPNGRHVDENH